MVGTTHENFLWYVNVVICCKIYFVFFILWFEQPRKYFYNENFQIYGIFPILLTCNSSSFLDSL